FDERPLDEVASQCQQVIEALTKVLEVDVPGVLFEFDLPLSRLAEIQAATSLLTSTRANVERSGFSDHLDRLASDAEGLRKTRDAIDWAKKVASTDLPPPVSAGLLSSEAGEWRARVREVASRYRAVLKAFDGASGEVSHMGLDRVDTFTSVRQLSAHLN